MTIRISKEFLLYISLLTMLTVFGLLYMAQSHAVSQQTAQISSENNNSNKTNVRIEHTSTQNGEVLGIVN